MNRLFFYLCPLVLILVGCDVTPPVGMTRGEAQSKFVELMQEEYKHDLVVHEIDNTLWIYIPRKDSLFDIKASKEPPQKSNIPEESKKLKFIDTTYSNQEFVVQYEVDVTRGYGESFGYELSSNPELQRIQSNVFLALQEAYFDVGLVPGDKEYLDPTRQKKHANFVKAHVKTDTPPEFVILILADIKNGLEYRSTLYFDDFKRSRTNPPTLPHEEYIKRTFSVLEGNKNIIGDATGEYLDFTPLVFPKFLAEQITHRIKFKFNQSSNPPSDDTAAEIKKIMAEAVGGYKFNDFETVKLLNLLDGESIDIAQFELLKMPEANK